MAGVDIQAKVKKGLARAINRTGSSSSPLVYKVERTSNGGTPMNPVAPTETDILLVDAIFKDYNETQIDQTLIKSGDRQLVTNGDVLIEEGDEIKVGTERLIVQSVDVKNPAGVPLAYIARVRPNGNYVAPPLAEATVTMADASGLTGSTNSVAYYDSGGTVLGSLVPDSYIDGDQINGFYTSIAGADYIVAMFNDVSFSRTEDVIVSVAGRSDVYTKEGGGFANRSTSSDLYDYLKGLEDTPSAFIVTGG